MSIEIGEDESLTLGITDKETTAYAIKTDRELGESYTGVRCVDWVKPQHARPIAHSEQPHIKDYVAKTRNEFGAGFGW